MQHRFGIVLRERERLLLLRLLCIRPPTMKTSISPAAMGLRFRFYILYEYYPEMK